MRKLLLITLVFAVCNFGLFLLHLALFKSNTPFLSWASILIHAVLLIIFPYNKIYKLKS